MASTPPLSLHGRTALLVLGVVFHAVYVLSIFDIYFKSPVVAHIESVHYAAPASSSSSPTISSSSLLAPPAQRLVVFVADGCRADKFFEVNATSSSSSSTSSGTELEARVSFLRRMVETQGSWGVSHTRVPTESRPGHVALFAGMYEDVSAVTKGWQDNPVDFDSIFNQSRHAWLFGSPDIVPMFARNVPQATERHYSHEEEDFAKDASELDVWVYDQFAALFERAASDPALEKKLRSPQLLFFCHFLGIDTNGHAHRPGSSDYLNNIALVDELVEKIYRLMEDFYDFDGKTAYVFSADHGMSNKGAHGDGDPSNTRTPLVAWGAGVDGPVRVANANADDTKKTSFQIDLPTQSRAHVEAQLRAQQQQEAAAAREWGSLLGLARKDVMQADVAPLISSLLGLPYPRNSVGVLPFTFLAKGQYRAKAVMSNAQQLFQHARRKEQEKEAQTLLFFAPLRAFRDDVPRLSQQLTAAWTAQDFELVERLSQELIAICLEALEYLQRYDWFFLLSVIVLGYIGWMLVLAVAFLHPTRFHVGMLAQKSDVGLWFLLFGVFTFLALESSPFTYFLYVAFPVVFWNFVWSHRYLLRIPAAQGTSTTKKVVSSSRWRQWGECGFVVLCLELVVLGFERRFIFGLVFSLLSAWPWLDTSFAAGPDEDETPTTTSNSSFSNKTTTMTLKAWTASCLFISVFPYLPTEYGEHTLLVVAGGIALLAFAFADVTRSSSSSSSSFLNGSRATVNNSSNSKLSWTLAFAVVFASLVTVQWTMNYLEDKRKPPVLLTLANWVLSVAPIVVLLVRLAFKKPLETGSSDRELDQAHEDDRKSQQTNRMLLRMVEIVLAVSPAYILLSISYEVFFFLALCCVLHSWIVLEAQLAVATSTTSSSLTASLSSSSSSTLRHEVRRAFFFLLLIKIAFFGTGNVASMSSFEISSTYRFVTVFAPFLMGALLVIKLLIPFLVVACAFHVVLELSQAHVAGSLTKRHPPSRYFLLVVAMADFLALHFLFLVKNEGSWKEIGNSISMFGIVNALIVFVPLLFLLARLFVRDLLLLDEVAKDTRAKTQ